MISTIIFSGRPLRSILIAGVCSVLLVSGCRFPGFSKDLQVAPEAYRGPALSHQTLENQYLVIVETPGGGWAVEIDATRKAADWTDVFVTLREPNSAGVYEQGPFEQRVLTHATTERPLRILARVLDHAADEDRPYRRVR